MDVHGQYESRIIWITGKIGMVKCAWVSVYAKVNEKEIKGKTKLKKKINKTGGVRPMTEEV